MRSTTRWRLMAGAVSGGLFVAASAVLVGGETRADRTDAGVRVPSGCTTEIDVSGGTRFVLSTELDGPALGVPDACVAVPAGRRGVTAARVGIDSADAAPLVPGDPVVVRLSPGRHAVTVVAEGSPGDAVVLVSPDPTRARTDARITAMVLLVAAVVVVALIPVLGRGSGGPGSTGPPVRPVIAVTAGPWAAPDPRHRVG